jgi:hypothetical protein
MAMNETKAIIAIASGCVVIVFSLTVKQFYAARGLYGVSNREIPRWRGRLLGLVVGVVMGVVGARFLLLGP